MKTSDIERVLTFAIEHREKAQEVFDPERPWDKWRSWPEAMADGFSRIEQHHLSTFFVFVHPDHLVHLLNSLSTCVVVSDQDEGAAADLWGADIWADPRVPKEVVLFTAEPKHVPEKGTNLDTPLPCLSSVTPLDKKVFGDDP